MAGKKIILVGCGNIGSRHLQALTKLNGEYLIEIIEPNDEAVLLAKLRLGEMKYDENLKKIVWKKSISKNTKNSDIVIIATNSKNRVKIIDELLKKFTGAPREVIAKDVLAMLQPLAEKGFIIV